MSTLKDLLAKLIGKVNQISSEKVDKVELTLGRDANGLLYLYIDGAPVGTGIELPTGGIDGYITEDKQIIFNNLPDGEYTLAYIMEDGTIVPCGSMEKDTNVYYSVTNNLTNCVTSNGATQVIEGESYSANITANSGYELKSLTVTMGGNPVTVSGGEIIIAIVTGNIVITAVAEEVKAAEPVTTNITLRNGIRLGSDGGDRTGATGYCATERINLANIPKPCTIRLTKAKWSYSTSTETGWNMTCAKNVSGSNLVVSYTNDTIGNGYFSIVRNNGKNTDLTVTVTSNEVAEICFSGNWSNSEVETDYGYSDWDTNMHAEATLTYTPAS